MGGAVAAKEIGSKVVLECGQCSCTTEMRKGAADFDELGQFLWEHRHSDRSNAMNP